MRKADHAKGVAPLVPKREQRLSGLALATHLYQSRQSFRSMTEFGAIGLCVLAFSGAFSSTAQSLKAGSWSVISGVSSWLTRPLADHRSQVKPGQTNRLTATDTRPGNAVIEALREFPQLSGLVERAPQQNRAALRMAISSLRAGELDQAFAKLDALDPGLAEVAYIKAWAFLAKGGARAHVNALTSLRGAMAKGYTPAITLNGTISFLLLRATELGLLMPNNAILIDDAGREFVATRADLVRTAVQSWQRAAGFLDPEAKRYLGLAAARGFEGNPNLVAAAALWREASEQGDRPATEELGKLYAEGLGVPANTSEAVQLFRKAFFAGSDTAGMFLGGTLLPAIITGDEAATKEAISVLRTLILDFKSDSPRNSVLTSDFIALAHFTLGMIFWKASPSSMRDPELGVDHLILSAKLKYFGSFELLANAYENGSGVKKDIVKSYGYYSLANKVTNNTFKEKKDNLQKLLSEEQIKNSIYVFMNDAPSRSEVVPRESYINRPHRKEVAIGSWFSDQADRTSINMMDDHYNKKFYRRSIN